MLLENFQTDETILQHISTLNLLGSWELNLVTGKAMWSKQTYINYGYEPFSMQPSVEFFLANLLPEFVPLAKEKLKSLPTSKKIETFQAKIRNKSGVILDIVLKAKALFNEVGEATKIIGTTQDITSLMLLQKENEELSQLMEKSSNEIYIVACD